MSLTTTMMENKALPTNGGIYVRPSNRPEGEGAALYPEGNPRTNTILQQAETNLVERTCPKN